MSKLHVIGIGYRPLDARSSDLIKNAEVILASKRLCGVFQRYAEFESVKEKIKVINKVDETLEFIRSSIFHLPSSIVLLASGDPLFFGIGRKALEEFGPENVEIIPDLSSVQLAFARIGEPWDNAFLVSLHGGPDPEKRRRLPYEIKDLPMLLERHPKIAILTDRENNPAAVARELTGDVRIFVCERLGYEDERVTEGTPEKISGMNFADPNVVVIIRETSASSFPLVGSSSATRCVGNPSGQKDCGQAAMTEKTIFGLTEYDIAHSRGLITKDEVRAVSIHKLRLPDKGVLWDIGAGSGSVSIEVARLCPGSKIFSIEKNQDELSNIRENISSFRVSNIEVISGEAPEALKDLPRPDRVFIGGSSGHLSEIVGLVSSRMLKGLIVINATTLETLSEATTSLGDHGFVVEVSEISVSRSKKIGDRLHMSALNPVFIIKGEKK